MMGMVVDLESSTDDLSHAFARPKIGRKPGGPSTLEENTRERLHSPLGQLGRSPSGRLRAKAFETIASDDRFPSHNRRWRHVERTNDLDVLLAGQKQPASSKTPSLLLLSGSKCSLHTYPYAMNCKSVHYFCDGQ